LGMYCKVSELVDAAELAGIAISEVMIQQEMASFGRTREEIFGDVERNLAVMEAAANRGMAEDIRSVSGLTGGDARRLRTYLSMGRFLSGRTVLESVCCALATNEVNAAMGTVCATPTAGASGVVPGTLLALKDKLNPSREQMLRFLFTAGAFGLAVANGATISGAEGGCQAEVGSATGMAAAAIVEMAGGTPQQSAHAMALALQNMLGLVCDPVAGLVEIPCIMRSAMGAAHAMVAADMALAGIESRIPCDEVIGALFEVGQALPATLRETGQGGLANTPTGRRMESQVFGSTRDDSSDSY
jgi:L-serine dehydratase